MRRTRPIAPPPALTATLAVVLCLGAVAATPPSTLVAATASSPARPLLQPRDEKVLSELLATLRDAARQMTQPAATLQQADRPTGTFAEVRQGPRRPEPPLLPAHRGDFRAHLLNLPPPRHA